MNSRFWSSTFEPSKPNKFIKLITCNGPKKSLSAEKGVRLSFMMLMYYEYVTWTKLLQQTQFPYIDCNYASACIVRELSFPCDLQPLRLLFGCKSQKEWQLARITQVLREHISCKGLPLLHLTSVTTWHHIPLSQYSILFAPQCYMYTVQGC